MIELAPDRLAAGAGAEIVREGGPGRPERAAIDTRELRGGELFFGLRGERADGGEYAAAALAAGAWGVVVEPERARSLAAGAGLGRAGRASSGADAGVASGAGAGWILAAPDPLAALQVLATAWRRELGCPVVGVTGSTGKTSVKDITKAFLPWRTHASPENYNTEIGLPLTVLAAPPETEVMVLEMAMRGIGQIAELCEIAEPDVAAITNIGPVHLELLGTVAAIAEAKAEIIAGLGEEGCAVVPADEEALEPHLRAELTTLTFGPGGDVFALEDRVAGERLEVTIVTPAGEARFELPFTEAHNLRNSLCAVAIGIALEAPVEEMARRAPGISFSRLRGERIELPRGSVLVNDCYNANPISMRAALDHLATVPKGGGGRRIAVLGGMAELGLEGPAFHREAGAHARELGVEIVVGVGELARDYAPDAWAPSPEAAVDVVRPLLGEGDAVLVKGSRSVGLERFTDELLRATSSERLRDTSSEQLRDTSSASRPGVSRSSQGEDR